MVIVVVVMIVTVFVAVIIAVIIPVFAVIIPMVFAIVRDVAIGVPVVPDEVDRLAAGVILAAVMAPVALIAWAHMQIDRRRQHAAMSAYRYDRRAIDEAGRGRVPEIYASIKAGVPQADGCRHLCERGAADCRRCKSQGEN
jgi:hypothetical protein